MIGFGKDNEEFGKAPPSIQSFKEIQDEEGFANNSLLIKIVTWTGTRASRSSCFRYPCSIPDCNRSSQKPSATDM